MPDLNLILNLDQQTPAARRVLSATARSLLDLPPLIAGSTYTLEVKGIDGTGAVYSGSGTSGWLPRLQITYVNAAGTVVVLAQVAPDAFAQITGGWSGALSLATVELLAALEDGADPLQATFELLVTDPSGYVHTWYRKGVTLLSRLYDPANPDPTPGETYPTLAQMFRGTVRHFAGVTTLLGGGATALNGQTTLGGVVTAGDKFAVYIPASSKVIFYQATAGNAGSDSEAAVRAADQPTALYYAKIGEAFLDSASQAELDALSAATTAALALKAPVASPTFTGAVTLPGDPASALQAATKQYVDNLAAGFDVKASVVVATTTNITLSGGQTIDGIAVTTGDRVLVKNQSTPAQNGLYLVAAGAWTRTTDADTWAKLPGAFCFVERGTTLADTGWVCTVDAGGTLGTTAVTFSQFSGVGAYQPLNTNLTAEAGLTGAADRLSYYTGLGAKALAAFTSFGRTLLAYADAAACFAGIKQQATTSATGVVELATDAETLAGTDTARVAPVSSAEKRTLLGDFTRQIRDSLYSDGATSNRRVEWTPGTAGAVAALPIDIPFEFAVPTSNPSASAHVWAFSASGTDPSNTANSLASRFTNSGGLDFFAVGTTPGTDFRRFQWDGFRAAYSGLWVRGMAVFSSADSTTPPTVYINGVDVSANFTATTGGTAAWVSSALVATKFVNALSWPAGRFIPHAPILGALTAAEVLEWTQTGRLPAWCGLGTGNAINRISNGDFETGTPPAATGWTYASGGASTVANVAAAGVGGTNAAVLTVDGSNSSAGIVQSLNIIAGRKYRWVFTAKVDSTTGIPDIASDYVTLGNLLLTTSFVTYSIEVVATLSSSSNAVLKRGNGCAGKTITIDNVAVYDLGPIFKPLIQPIAVLADAGTNKIAGILTSGITPITEKRDWLVQASTNTNGNQQLLGASAFFDATRHVIDDWCMNTTGTPTVTAGSASGGTQYKASGALAATRNLITLVTRVLATANLWCGSNDTSTIQHTIRGHIVD